MYTPTLTVLRLRDLIASLLEELLEYNRPANAHRRATRWLQRIESACYTAIADVTCRHH